MQLCLGLLVQALAQSEVQTAESPQTSLVATFSVVGFDPKTGDLGIAVQSKFFGVGTVVPWAKANVGAVATQSYANIAYGSDGLALMEQGVSPDNALIQLTEADARSGFRQVGMVNAEGKAAAFTGSQCNAWAGHIVGPHFAVQGNLLTDQTVVESMAQAYRQASEEPDTELADWLMAALKAGQAAGGDKRGRQSAALLVVREKAGYGGHNDRYIDLRVEDHSTPILELHRLLDIHKQFYQRAHRNKPKRN